MTHDFCCSPCSSQQCLRLPVSFLLDHFLWDLLVDLEADPHFDNNIEEEESDDEESDEESDENNDERNDEGEIKGQDMSTKGEINPSMRNSKLRLDENHETQSVNSTDVIKRNVFSRADILRRKMMKKKEETPRAFRHLPGARKRSFGADTSGRR